MKKSQIVFITFVFICLSVASAAGEDFLQAYKLLTPVFQSENAWELTQKDIQDFAKILNGFSCNSRKYDSNQYLVCTSKGYTNNYKILFEFEQSDCLKAVELQISGSNVEQFLSNPTYTPSMLISMIKDKFIKEEYIETTDALPDIKDKFNRIYYDFNTVPVLNMRYNENSMMSAGYILKTRQSEKDTLIFVFSEADYFYRNQMVYEYNESTGETRVSIISYGN